jgi:3-dehydroquinate synthase
VKTWRIRVGVAARPYDVHVSAQGAEFIAAALARLEGDWCVVTDTHVARAVWPGVGRELRRRGCRVPAPIVIPAGERKKKLATVERVQRELLRRGADRSTCVIALGGGVVGDLAGFAAATYMRGIDWIAAPTSLLAMVDAAVGGKVGVNLGTTKNAAGAFHQPRAVWAATGLLRTLPDRERRSGLGEIVKYGMIADAGLFRNLERDARTWRAPRAAPDAALVARCVRIKARFVAADEREAGMRAALNFGHTVGHALEGDGRRHLRHGEAVGLGMLVASAIAAQLGIAAGTQRARLAELLDALGLPTRVRRHVPVAVLREAWRRDKKTRHGVARFVLTPDIGTVSVGHHVPDDIIVHALQGILDPQAPATRSRLRRASRRSAVPR